MARSHQQHPAVRASLPVAILLLLVFAVLPARYTDWTEGIGQLVETALMPIAHPLRIAATWLAPAQTERDVAEVRRLREEAERFEFLWRRERVRNERLAERLEALQRGLAFNPEVPVRLMAAPVASTSSDPTSGAFRVRAGTDDGVTPRSTVATTGGTQLVGRVIDVGPVLSTVVPITDPGAGEVVDCVIIPDDGAADPDAVSGIGCLLQPAPGGRLTGEAAVLDPTPARPDPPEPRPGMTVRLRDEAGVWPASARMLVVGVVERVRRDPEQPLRPIVTVRPRVQLRRLSEVVLRIPLESPGRGDAGDTEAAP